MERVLSHSLLLLRGTMKKVATVRLGGYDALRGHAEIQGDLRWNVS